MRAECDYCIHLLLDDLDVLDRNVSTVRRQLADVSVGVAAFNRLAQYNNTVTELRVCGRQSLVDYGGNMKRPRSMLFADRRIN